VRTTLTLEDDLALILRREAEATGLPFRTVVNDALRRGLEAPRPREDFNIPPPVALGPPLVDLARALSLADEDFALFPRVSWVNPLT